LANETEVQGTTLTPRRVARIPAPGMNVPTAVRFSPNGKLLTFLWSEEGTLQRQLYAYDPETRRRELLVRPPGEGVTDANVSREEALRRERQRERGFGVTSYAWSREGDTLLVPIRGDLYVQHGTEGPLRQVTEGMNAIDPQLSRDGSMVAFVSQGELYSLDLTRPHAAPVRLTRGARRDASGEQVVTNGLAEFAAQEEMGRSSGFWWSRDGRFIAYQQVDNSRVTQYTIVHQGEDSLDSETHRYPFAGEANVLTGLYAVPARGGEASPLLAVAGYEPEAEYLARVDWAPDGMLLVQLMSRDQKRLELRRIDPQSGGATTVLVETAIDWINLHDDLRCVPRSGGEGYEILWSSERSGMKQLYLYDADGTLLRQLTPGPWPVDGVAAVDEERRIVYFRGSESPLEAHVWRVSVDGGAPERLTHEPGMHGAVFSPDCSRFTDLYHSLHVQPRLVLRDADGTELQEILASSDPEPAALGLRPPELVALQARDGETLYGAIYRPREAGPGQRFPVLVEVYGGPHVQTVSNSWGMTASLRAQFLAQHGFIVFKLDNRGSARRGHTFEAPIYRRMGTVEVDDQVDGVRWLAANVPEADTSRTGVYGWSYGGYLTLMCLLKAADVFKAGVAGAPVTSWDGYDTFYTERYMETPQRNPEGYREGSALTFADRLAGTLLLVHGMLDENVHFRHTARLINALNVALKPYELIIFPSERHGPRSEDQRAALEQRLLEFFQRALA
jgi:dipeptidyl-peptidase-4